MVFRLKGEKWELQEEKTLNASDVVFLVGLSFFYCIYLNNYS